MTPSRTTDTEPPRVWPRTEDDYCSCPYCTAIREGRIAIPDARSLWAQRMGAGR
jgi:hypothetical protein